MKHSKKYRRIIGFCNWSRIDMNEEYRNASIEARKQLWEESQKILPQKFNRKCK